MTPETEEQIIRRALTERISQLEEILEVADSHNERLTQKLKHLADEAQSLRTENTALKAELHKLKRGRFDAERYAADCAREFAKPTTNPNTPDASDYFAGIP